MAKHVDPAAAAAGGAATKLPEKLADFTRVEFEDTCKRRFFFGLSNDPYGGTAGLYDLGPPMCAMKSNLLAFWRQHFVLEESMCEVDTTCLTPHEVFVASGHVERFNDIMVRDTVTGECIRIDKWIEEWCDLQVADPKASPELKEKAKALHTRAPNLDIDEIPKVLAEFGIKSSKGNPLSEPFPFNLMFKTQIGPEGHRVGYARPELAQGIILNFKRLMDSNNAQRMPFAGACIGQAFRNEIAPRAALLRVREFTLAEIEHFVNPADKSHPKFAKIADLEFWGWPRALQETNADPIRMTFGKAVADRIIDNETIAYFMARTKLFLEAIGVKYLRFRQHGAKEMAHYAQDCWDAEILTSYGWVECVGIADRSAYDLTAHSRATGRELSAREEFAEPKMIRVVARKINKGACGKKLGKDTGILVDYINSLSEEAALKLDAALKAGPTKVSITAPGSSDAREVELTADMVQFEEKDERITGRNYIPSVIEPSFGIGRVMYSLLEQSYWVRRDETGKNDKRAVFSLKPIIAPQKVAVLPLMMKDELTPVVDRIREELIANSISTRTDDSGVAIGKKYARIDELGIPFVITVDFEGDGRVTLRERDSAKQVRVPVDEVVGVVSQLCRSVNALQWEDVEAKYPEQVAK